MNPNNGKVVDTFYLNQKGWRVYRKDDAGKTYWLDPFDNREEREDHALLIQRQRDSDPDLFPDRPGIIDHEG